jgi:hypothetical protein
MLGLSRRWIVVAILAGALKIILASVSTGTGDFPAFVGIAQSAFLSLRQGLFPYPDAYTGMALFLAPFYALWAALPIDHPPISHMIGDKYFVVTPASLLLVLSMKLPIFVLDLATAVFIFYLVRRLTYSAALGGRGFLLWYLNPYNTFMIEIWGSYDIVPAAILLLAVLLAVRSHWVKSAVSLFAATVLRIFPLLLFPTFWFSVDRTSKRRGIWFAGAYLAPILAVFILLALKFGSFHAIGDIIVGTATYERWILPILYGFPITSGLDLAPNVVDVPVPLILFALPVQLYVIAAFWRKNRCSILDMTLASLLVYFAASFHEPYHFTWVTPLLTAYVAMKKERLTLFGYLFLAAFIAMVTYSDVSADGTAFFLLIPFNKWLRQGAAFLNTLRNQGTIFRSFEGFYQGVFHGLLAAFVLEVNLFATGLTSKLMGRHSRVPS